MKILTFSSFKQAQKITCDDHGFMWVQGQLWADDDRLLIDLVYECGCEETAEIVED